MIKRASIIILLQILVVFSASFLFFAYAAVEETSLGPIDDAYVSSLYPYVNRGSDKQLLLANYRSGDIEVRILVYIKFDLSHIPSDVETISAKLELYAISVTVPSEISINHCPYNAWNELQITYANAPEYDPTSTSSTYVSRANAWYSWDLTSDVRNARGGQLTEVLRIDLQVVPLVISEPNHVSFYSKEASDSSYRPRLTINHSKPRRASSITCHIETKTIELGEKLEVTGAISPPHGGVSVTITYRGPDGRTFTRKVPISSDGTFSDSFAPESSGQWSVYASWAGDEDHYGSAGEIASFTVKEKLPTTPTPAPSTTGFPIFWTSVLIILALCLFAAFLFVTRRKRGAPPAREQVKPVQRQISQVIELEALRQALDPTTLKAILEMLSKVKNAKKHRQYGKIDTLTSQMAEIALGPDKPRDASNLDFRDQLKLLTLVFEYVRDQVPYKGEPFGGLIRWPWETLKTGGDCDCKSVTLAAMLESLGFRKLVLSVLPPGKYVDAKTGETKHVEGHVFLEVGLVKDEQTIWVRLDPSCPDCDVDDLPEAFSPFIPNFYRVPIQ